MKLHILFPLLLTSALTAKAGVVIQLSFDEGKGDTVRDASGQDHHGKITGAQWTEGKSGKALVFKGPAYEGPARPPGTFVRIAGSEALNPTKAVEISATVYPTFRPVAWGGIVEKGVGYGSSYRLMILRNGHVRAAIGNQHSTVDSPEPLELDAWTKLKMVFDGKSLRLLINDEEVAQAAVKPGKLVSEYPIEIGRRFTGKIDDLKVVY